jgi:hypothetical protein
MLTITENVIAVAATVLASLLFLLGLNRVWPWEKRRVHNDFIGWQFSILGTTYAVTLGFMLYAVWTSSDGAELNVDHEAAAVIDLYRLADALPEPQGMQLQTLVRSYLDSVINQEWPQMVQGEAPARSPAISQMWKTVVSIKAASPTEVNAQAQAMSELSAVAQHRLTRIVQSTAKLPNVLWCLLLLGGALTIISSCMFGTENVKLQAVKVFGFSLLISLTLVAISDIHRPFHGLLHVTDQAFRRAQQIVGVN